jgi:hypothetical protein
MGSEEVNSCCSRSQTDTVQGIETGLTGIRGAERV